MNLVITLTDEQLSTLKEALKITHEDYELMEKLKTPPYARRIFDARRALSLSLRYAQVVSDPQRKEAGPFDLIPKT